MMKEERVKYYDLAKAIGIICVLIGHSSISNKVNILIYTFHMPLFYFISGLLVREKIEPWSVFVYKKVNSLLKPYLYTSITTIIFGTLITGGVALLKDREMIFYQTAVDWLHASVLGLGYREEIAGENLPAIGPVWFLLALFFSLLLQEIYKRISKNNTLVPAIIIGTLGCLSKKYIFLPFSIQEGMLGAVFVSTGYELKRRRNKLSSKAIQIVIWCISILYIFVNLFSNTHIDLVKCDLPWGIIDILGTISCVLLVLIVSKFVCEKCEVNPFVIYIGKYTLMILCLHTIEFNIMPWWILSKICDMFGVGFLYPILQCGIRIIGCIVVVVLMEMVNQGRNYKQYKRLLQ